MRCLKIGVLSLLVTSSIARDIPDNLRDFYNHLRGSNGCGNKLASGFYAKADGSNCACLPRVKSIQGDALHAM